MCFNHGICERKNKENHSVTRRLKASNRMLLHAPRRPFYSIEICDTFSFLYTAIERKIPTLVNVERLKPIK